jgi:hypothetical protein
MHDPLARLLALRIRYRRNPEARAYVDRALAILARATAEDADLDALDADVNALADDLGLRFAAPSPVNVQ